MKKALKFIAIFLLILVIIVIATPFLFKTQISNVVKNELSKQMEAEVEFGSVNISIFKHFPDLTLSLNQLSIIEPGKDTLISMDAFLLDMQTWSAITQNELRIKSLVLNKPRINIVMGSSDTIPEEMTLEEQINDSIASDDVFLVKLNNFSIVNGAILFKDTVSIMEAAVEGINMTLSGDFSELKTVLNVEIKVNNLYYSQDNETLIKGFPASLQAKIDADLNTQFFTLKENSLKLGVLNLELEGIVDASSENIGMDLKLNAPVTDMSDLIEMLPESYASMLKGIKTDGNIGINGFIKGEYIDSERLPEFNLAFNVSNGVFKYPDLPKSIGNINISANVSHPNQTNADATLVKIDNFSCDFGGNPIESKWIFSTPVSDLNIDGYFKGKVDLASLKDVIPLEDYDIKGKINADVKLKGKMSAIEKEDYEKFNASGFMTLKAFWFKSNDVPQGISINESTLAFSPKQIDLKSFSAQMGQSDFTLSGKISNYINYVFSNGTLNGSFTHYSAFINANEFLDEEDNASTETTPTESSPFIVPDKLNLVFTSNIDRMLFDNLRINGTRGKISVMDRKTILDGIKMELLEGSMVMTGVYNSSDTLNVFADMHLNIDNIDVSKTSEAFSAVRKLAPIATYTEGRISFNMDYYSPFMSNGEVDLNKLTSSGYVSSPSLLVKNNSSLDELAKVTNNSRYKNLRTGSFKANYIVENGKVIIKPFKVRIEDKNMEIWGEHSLANVMDYRIKTTVAANELGSDVAKLVKLVSDPNKQLPVTVIIKGDIKKPVVSLDAKDALKQLQKDASKGLLKGLF